MGAGAPRDGRPPKLFSTFFAPASLTFRKIVGVITDYEKRTRLAGYKATVSRLRTDRRCSASLPACRYSCRPWTRTALPCSRCAREPWDGGTQPHTVAREACGPSEIPAARQGRLEAASGTRHSGHVWTRRQLRMQFMLGASRRVQ